MGTYLDNMMGGNHNPTYGQMARRHNGFYPRYSYPFR
ncbi:unnamed protein product, partial [Rotaria sp. Silwood1]